MIRNVCGKEPSNENRGWRNAPEKSALARNARSDDTVSIDDKPAWKGGRSFPERKPFSLRGNAFFSVRFSKRLGKPAAKNDLEGPSRQNLVISACNAAAHRTSHEAIL